jgi:hypothetical protein
MAARLTVNQIGDMIEQLDDSFNDPAYEGEMTESSRDSEIYISASREEEQRRRRRSPSPCRICRGAKISLLTRSALTWTLLSK